MPYVNAIAMGKDTDITWYYTEKCRTQLVNTDTIFGPPGVTHSRQYTVTTPAGNKYFIHYKKYNSYIHNSGGIASIYKIDIFRRYLKYCYADRHYLVAYDSTFTNPLNMTREDAIYILPRKLRRKLQN